MASPAPVPPPVVLVTCGDPAGVGPELVAAAWTVAPHARARLRVVADAPTLANVLARRGLPVPRLTPVHSGDPRPSGPADLLVIEPGGDGIDPAAIPDGVVSAAGGSAAARAVEVAAAAALAGTAAAIVTGPLHKEALHAAGYGVPGHTELLARACGLADDAASMMLWLPGRAEAPHGLGVVHVTLHEPLARAVARLSVDGIVAAGRRLREGLTHLVGREPRLAVAALNPHGGEGGLFGDEEPRIMVPAVDRLASEGGNVRGPLPADTLFVRAMAGEFDGIVALYHDQGHIPVKLLGLHRAVNVTLGLPLVRTSVAHGTAFDLVGTGRADPTGLVSAIDAAVRLAMARRIRAASGPSF
ncbi:MAG: 4-hydroxythreonine-4-phosphate dehydrogenase PdxA [Planctomycetes bacterium]|nr:4-hydroxythreonine-4-phosphate dehydrogenase PdxA [Planctomycetota bacterium]